MEAVNDLLILIGGNKYVFKEPFQIKNNKTFGIYGFSSSISRDMP